MYIAVAFCLPRQFSNECSFNLFNIGLVVDLMASLRVSLTVGPRVNLRLYLVVGIDRSQSLPSRFIHSISVVLILSRL
jgi:hypothetical protein